MFVSVIKRYSLTWFRLSAVRFASSKGVSKLPKSAVLGHNWFETIPEVNLNDPSNLPEVPDRSFNQRLLLYLADAVKRPLSAQVNQHISTSFQDWSPKEFYDLISILGAYGLQPMDVLHLLAELPSADKSLVNVENFKKTFEDLLKLKFDTTTRSILISNDPNLIQYNYGYLRERLDVLLCYFTFREVQKLVRTHRKLFSESWSDLDYKINYLKIVMFASTRDIVESGALAFSMDHIRHRCIFAFRTGSFKRVRREEQYLQQRQINISLTDLFSSSLKTFLKRTSNNLLRPDDFQAFVDSLQYESFDNEINQYLTLENRKSKWSKSDIVEERKQRLLWMSEFDMYNDEIPDDHEETSLTLVNEKPMKHDDEKISPWHLLSDWKRDRHRSRKIRQNIDPNLRM